MNESAVTSEQSTSLEAIAIRAAAIKAELARRDYLDHPDMWAAQRLKSELWSAQKAILCAVRDHRKVAIPSCHGAGKSFISSVLVGWWIDNNPLGDAFVVTSAPSAPQVRAILWREINRVHARGKLKGRVNQTEWHITMPSGKEELVAFGRKPADYNPTSFQGIHARRVLVLFDEATGIASPLWDAGDSLTANNFSKFVCTGNPDVPQGEFHKACKPGSGFHVIHISAFDTPNFTGEPLASSIKEQLIGEIYVEEKRRKWAPTWTWIDDRGVKRCVPPADDPGGVKTNPYWQSKVLGRFPENSVEGGLIPLAWIRGAQDRTLKPDVPNELGCDIGGGGDENAVCHRRGFVYRILRTDTDPDTMSQCGKIIEDLRSTGARVAKIDKIGIGWGVVDRGREQGFPFVGINVGEGVDEDAEQAEDERFANLKAQLYWKMREAFERGEVDIDPLDEDLASELASIRWERTSKGKIKISDKRKDANGRTIASPNRAEAMMLSMAPDAPPTLEEFVTW